MQTAALESGDDSATAGLLRHMLRCEVAALVTLDRAATKVRAVIWPADGGQASNVLPLSELVWNPRTVALDVLPGRHTMVVPFAPFAAWLVGRTDQPFTAADVDHVALLAPGLHQRWVQKRYIAVLTRRELTVLGLVGEGLTSRLVARRCGISERTVHKHLEHAYAKLGCRDRLSAVLRLLEAGLLGAEQQ